MIERRVTMTAGPIGPGRHRIRYRIGIIEGEAVMPTADQAWEAFRLALQAGAAEQAQPHQENAA